MATTSCGSASCAEQAIQWSTRDSEVRGRWPRAMTTIRATFRTNSSLRSSTAGAAAVVAERLKQQQQQQFRGSSSRRHRWVAAGLAEEVAAAREWEGDAGRGRRTEQDEPAEEAELIARVLSTIQATVAATLASSSSSSCTLVLQPALGSSSHGGGGGNPYDAAWVAMLPAGDGSARPHFYAALNWVRGSQLPDGSWAGDWRTFHLHDRVVCTLACVLALATWSRAKHAVARGCAFLSARLLEVDAQEVQATLGLEIVLCAMLERAQVLRLDLPYDAPILVRSERERKVQLLSPLEHRCCPLLQSLEGLEKLPGLDWWTRLLHLQELVPPLCPGVSLPVADGDALRYLARLRDKVSCGSGGLTAFQSLDVMERLWVVDRLYRLGVARYCQREIRDFLTS